MEKRVPAYIITGFLGSGKTTILQNILQFCEKENLKPAIVLNEIGETNVEADLFSDETVLEMLNGCICCSIQDDFTNELSTFLTSLKGDAKPDILLIEGTGIANPLEIVDALTDPLLIELVDLYSVINLIDASKYIEYQSIFSSSKEVREVLKSQIANSSMIVLNKVDLTDEKLLVKVRKKINEQKRNNIPIIETKYGELAIHELLEKRISISRSNRSLDFENEENSGCRGHHRCQQHDHHDNHSFSAIKIDVEQPIDRLQFEKWLKKQPKTMVRAKGIIQLTETAGLFQFQYSSNQLKLNRLKSPAKTRCVILIGTDLDRDAIENSFANMFI